MGQSMVDPEADEIIETWLLKDFKTIVFGKKKKKKTLFLFFPLFLLLHPLSSAACESAGSQRGLKCQKLYI